MLGSEASSYSGSWVNQRSIPTPHKPRIPPGSPKRGRTGVMMAGIIHKDSKFARGAREGAGFWGVIDMPREANSQGCEISNRGIRRILG